MSKHAGPLLVLIALAGCLQAPAAPAAPAPLPTPTTPGPPEPLVPEWGIEGPTETRTMGITVFAGANRPVPFRLAYNGTPVYEGTLQLRTNWSLMLDYGTRPFEFHFDDTPPQTFAVNVTRLASTQLRVDYGRYHPGSTGAPKAADYELWINVDERPSQAAYQSSGGQRIPQFNAHDHLVVLSRAQGVSVDFEYSPSFKGFSVSRIDGAGSPVASSAPPWWCYKVNDASANGISIQPIRPLDRVAWTLGSCT